MAPLRQTCPEGRGQTLDSYDVIVGFYRMYDLRACTLYWGLGEINTLREMARFLEISEPITYYRRSLPYRADRSAWYGKDRLLSYGMHTEGQGDDFQVRFIILRPVSIRAKLH